jgi:hypothetical protein
MKTFFAQISSRHLSIILVIGLVALFLMNETANSGNQETFGYKLGFNFSNVSGMGINHIEQQPANGLIFGVFKLFPIHHSLQIQPEILLTQKGFNRNYDLLAPDGTIHFNEKVRLTYAEMPILVRLPFPTRYAVKPAIFIGPAISLAIKGSVDGEYDASESSLFDGGSYSGNISNKRILDFGIVLGGDVRYPIGSVIMIADVRYTFGFGRMFDDFNDRILPTGSEIPITDYHSGEGGTLRNNAVSISLGLIMGNRSK